MAYPFKPMDKKGLKKLLRKLTDSYHKRNTLNHRFDLSPQESKIPFRNKPIHPGKKLFLSPHK